MKQRRAWCFHLMICSFILEAPRKMTNIDIENKNSLCTCTHRKVHNAVSQANPTHPRCWTSASRLGVQIPMHRFGKLRLPEQNLMLPKDMLFDVEDPCVLYILRVSWPPSYLPACQEGMGKRTICVSKRVSKACADTAACLRVGMAAWKWAANGATTRSCFANILSRSEAHLFSFSGIPNDLLWLLSIKWLENKRKKNEKDPEPSFIAIQMDSKMKENDPAIDRAFPVINQTSAWLWLEKWATVDPSPNGF